VIVLLNNDVDCPPDFLERLIEPLEEDALIGSVAAVLVQANGDTIDSVGLTADVTLAGFPRLRGRPLSEANSKRPVLTGPAGAAGAYRRTAWEQMGGLDEGVFMYGEDLELALRLRAAGWATSLATGAVAVHYGSATARHRSASQRLHSGFARGYFLRRYGVLRSRAFARTLVTEAIVIVGDAMISRDISALRGRISGWRSAAGAPRRALPPRQAIDETIGFTDSLRLRRGIYGR
jgi:GT2 family glycosyltransferase